MNIYDCFMYYDEDLLLDIRLNVLNKYVKKFVITEATYTHNGNKKKLNFNIQNFSKFKDKIEYIIVDQQPPNIKKINDQDTAEISEEKFILNGMARDYFQRECLKKGLKNLDEEDLVIISDLDEIPNLENLKKDEIKNNIIIFQQKMFYYKLNLLYDNFIWAGSKAIKYKKKSYIIDIGSNDGVALKPFLDLGFKKVLGVEPARNLAKLANKNKIKTFNGFLEKKNLKRIKKKADLILASNVFAHSDKLKEMAECMLTLLSKKGTIVIEVQYLMNTLKDLTFDNIYHEHYNYWSLTSLVNFFNQFKAKIYRSETVDTHGGSIRIYVKKDPRVKIETSVKKMLLAEEKYGIKKFKTYKKFGEKIYKIKENVLANLKKLIEKNKIIIGYGAPAKATTALNFFGVSKEINFIVEDNKLKHNKFVPGVNIPIKNKSKIKNKNNVLLVLAWNFYDDIKKNNLNLSDNFVNIKELESNN